ncbi:hypothetical protein COF09_05390 [Bacillus toyonensis]|uniref:hypothetical protein n=1 Tax=Bacillus toyonensis TaxID=155322 RepID=UPI000BFE3231|nr:hypothetical protein [Bacillus toyonensis]PHC44603.1 hypothetical protein COF09_05390 [Bacillus toyonensis]
MKKLFSFLLFVFVIFSANNISFADEVIPFNKSFFAYNEPSFTSAKGNGGAQYGPQKALTVKEKRSDGWWKIGTWEGDKWINTDGEKKKIEKPYITFAEPKFTSPKGNNGNVIAPQVVTAIDGQEDGWLKIQTNEGDKWIFLNSEAVKVDKNFYAYNEPSFTSEKASGGNQYGPQKSLVVKEKRTNGWWKVATYEGDKWVNLDGELKAFDKPFLVFYEPAFASQKGNMEVPYSPTTIRVVDGNTKGWFKVQTWEGDKWMYPGVAETVAVNHNFNSYNEPSFTSAKASAYGPQKFLAVVEKRQDGWWKIVTANEGLKWVALNGAKQPISGEFSAFEEPTFGSKMVSRFTAQTVLVKEDREDGWLLIGTYLGDKWINPLEEVEYNKLRKDARGELNYNEYDYINNPKKLEDEARTQFSKALAAPSSAERSLVNSGDVPRNQNIVIPTKEEIKAYQEKKKAQQASVARGLQAAPVSAPSSWPRKGDVVVTPNANLGITGHTAIIARDYDDAPDQYGEYIQIVHTPGDRKGKPTVVKQALASWEFAFKRLWYVRPHDRQAGIKAANYSVNHFLNLGYYYQYKITSSMIDTRYVYCSSLVYQSYAFGADKHFFGPLSEKYAPVHPYDFTMMAKKGNGFSWLFSSDPWPDGEW